MPDDVVAGGGVMRSAAVIVLDVTTLDYINSARINSTSHRIIFHSMCACVCMLCVHPLGDRTGERRHMLMQYESARARKSALRVCAESVRNYRTGIDTRLGWPISACNQVKP